MPKKPKGETITYEQLSQLFSTIPSANLTETQDFLEGDHWQDTKGWIGYLPSKDNPEDLVRTLLQLERAFVPKNVSLGMVKRIVGAILGKEPDWKIASKAEVNQETLEPSLDVSDKFFEDFDRELTTWYSEKEVHKHLKRFIFNKAAYGKASLQIYIPIGYLSDDSRVEAFDLKEALSKIFVRCPHWSEILDAKDTYFGKDFVVTQYKDEENLDEIYFEVCYADTEGVTHLREVRQNAENDKKVEAEIGGNLLTFIAGEFNDAIISPTVKAQQKALNCANTGEQLALQNISFPDTTFINADLPTETKRVEDKVETVVKPLRFGAGFWRNLKGLRYATADGGEQIVTPSVKFREPPDPDKFRKVAEKKAFDMHEEAGMGFIYISSNPYPSGESRIESMTDYIILLADNATLCDSLGVWLFDTVAKLALDILNQKERQNDYSVIFSSKITVGRLTVEERRLMLDEVAEGVRSRRNYQIKAEVTDDPIAEDKTVMLEFSLKPKQEEKESESQSS